MTKVRKAARPGYCRLALVLLSAVVSLPACTNYVEGLQHRVSPQPLIAATVAPQQHALAILGVDFDPPLLNPRVLPPDGVSLLVAVENQGLVNYSDVAVVARLLSVEGESTSELLSETVYASALPAGEVRFVRFTQVSPPPELDGHYRLVVELQPVDGETTVSDNRLIYDVLFRSGQ